jgi:hypothetical protein
MMTSRVGLFVFVLACGGSTPPPNNQTTAGSALPAVSSAEGLAIVAMKADIGEHDLELKSDGTVLFDGAPMGKVVGFEVRDLAGVPIIATSGDGSIAISGTPAAAKLDGNDVLQMGDGVQMSVADDGTIALTDKDGKRDPDRVRTALMLVLASHATH